MIDRFFELARRRDQARCQEPPAERVLVVRAPEDRFVNRLELPQRELPRQQLEPDRSVVELAAESLDDEAEDLGMIEGQRQLAALAVQGFDRPALLALPGDLQRGELKLRWIQACRIYEGVVGDADHARSRIAVGQAEGI